MDSKREQFLKRAEEADEKASVAIDPGIATGWREIAASWRYLAEHVED